MINSKGSYSLENMIVAIIIYPRVQRNVQGIVLALSEANVFDVSSSREEIPIPM
jgi:hypothetical protein